MIPTVAVLFRIVGGFRFFVPGRRVVDGGGDYSGEIGLAQGRQGWFSDHTGLSKGGCEFQWSC